MNTGSIAWLVVRYLALQAPRVNSNLGVKAVVEVRSGWTPENPFPLIRERKIQPLAVTPGGQDLSF